MSTGDADIWHAGIVRSGMRSSWVRGPTVSLQPSNSRAADRSVLVLEAADRVGGGLRSDTTAFGAVRDLGAAVVPFAAGSSFFDDWARRVGHPRRPLRAPRGLLHPSARRWPSRRCLAGPRRHGGVPRCRRRRLPTPRGPLRRGRWDDAGRRRFSVRSPRIPRHPVLLARYGLDGLDSARRIGNRFVGDEAAGLLAGCAAHGVLPLERPLTAAFATCSWRRRMPTAGPSIEGGTRATGRCDGRRHRRTWRRDPHRRAPSTASRRCPSTGSSIFDTDAAQVAQHRR